MKKTVTKRKPRNRAAQDSTLINIRALKRFVDVLLPAMFQEGEANENT